MTKREVKIAGYWSVKHSIATFVLKKPPIQTTFLGNSTRLILKGKSLNFNDKCLNGSGNKNGDSFCSHIHGSN